MKELRCIFFDLDHTLWDYDTNSKETISELFERHRLLLKGIPDAQEFHLRFIEINDALWTQYDTGKIASEVIRTERFFNILKSFDIEDRELSMALSNDYINECPQRSNLMPFAIDTLEYLHGHYRLAVITNGFDQTQHAKISAGGIGKYFDHIITSQRAGNRKPEKGIFDFALNLNASQPHEAMMIGDNLVTDINGARNASVGTVYYNPRKIQHSEMVDFEIHALSELKIIL